jgi:hypothetical protein
MSIDNMKPITINTVIDNNKEEETMNLNKIVRIDLNGNTDEIIVFPNELARKLETIGRTDALIKVNSLISDKLPDEEKAAMNQQLQEWTANGIHLGNKIYRPFFIGASDSRNATSAWLDEELLPEIGKWAMCGIKTSDMHIAVNKYLAYIALLASATRSFESVFGTTLDPRKIVVVPDYNVVVKGKVDFVNNNTIEHDVDRDVTINAFDGCGIVMPYITKNTACTIRAPWMKALIIPGNFRRFAVEHSVKEIVDLWGNAHKIEEIDAVLTKSCFKMAAGYTSWKQYCDAFEQLGHRITVCVEEHAPRAKWMPYQQLQTLAGNDDDVKAFAAKANHVAYEWQKPAGAAKLIGGWAGKAARINPNILADANVQERLQEAFAAKRMMILGGKVPDLGYNAFLAPDPVALMEHVCGLPVKGVLNAGECCCANCNLGEVDVTRNPHFDHAHVLLNNVTKKSYLFYGPTFYINIFDLTTIRLRADYDGDHVWYSQDPILLDLVHRTNDQYKNLPIDWIAPESVKGKINKGVVAAAFQRNTQQAQIGLFADGLTKMFANGYDRDVCAWLTYAGNVLIDAAKHGNANIDKPADVNETMKGKLPLFAKFAKANPDRPLEDEEYWTKRCEETDSFADRYSAFCDQTLPKELVVEGSDEFVFNVSDLMIDAHRPSGWAAGLYHRATNPNDWDGLFNQIAFRHAREWTEVSKADVAGKKATWEQLRGAAALEEIKAFCEERGETIEAAYDVICRHVFASKASFAYNAVVKDAFWRIFGEMAVNVLKSKAANADNFDIDLDWLEDDEAEEE